MTLSNTLIKKLGLNIDYCLTEVDGALGICNYPNKTIELLKGLGENWKEHVILHEVAHYTGIEGLLNRVTLSRYEDDEIYALVEELIAEYTSIALMKSQNIEYYDSTMINALNGRAELEGIELEEDVFPEVERILDFVTKLLKEGE